MNCLIPTVERLPIFISTEGAENTRQISQEPAVESDDVIYFYSGITGAANYLFDLFIRILQLFICCFTRPWPKWSWTTKEIVVDEVIHITNGAGTLKTDEFFRHLMENARLPLNQDLGTRTWQDLSDDLCFLDGNSTKEFVIRRTYHDNLLTQTQILSIFGKERKEEVCSFSRSKFEISERLRGEYVSNHIRDNSLFISYADRCEFKREVVKEGLSICGVAAVNGSTGHLEDHILNFFEDTIFYEAKNGCTAVSINPDSRDLELRATIPATSYEEMLEKVEAFNKKQVALPDRKDHLCRAEITKITSNDHSITDVILAIKRVDPCLGK